MMLDITITTPVIIFILSTGFTLSSGMGWFIWNVNKGFHIETMGKLDDLVDKQKEIEQEIRPIAIQVAVNTEKIANLEETLQETNKLVGRHSLEIQRLQGNDNYKHSQ